MHFLCHICYAISSVSMRLRRQKPTPAPTPLGGIPQRKRPTARDSQSKAATEFPY